MTTRPENSLTEKELVELIRKKDTRAEGAFYDRYAGYLTAVCSRYITGRESARDVLQDAFVKIFSQWNRFEYRGEGSLKAWTARIVANTAIKALRHEGELVHPERFPETATEPEEDPPAAEIPPEVLQEMIRKLPPGYRTVFNLYVFEDYKHKEIARLLGIGESSSASQLSRAKSLLAKEIKEYQKKHAHD